MSSVRASTRAMRGAYHVARAGMFRYAGGDPEKIHELLVDSLAGLAPVDHAAEVDPVTIAGIRFPNRVGLAAGLDKDGRAAAAWTRFGFGFAELGTVTASGQPGNDRPRLFRLKKSQAIINRMGFNNRGAAAMAAHLAALGVSRGTNRLGIPLGISIGKTKVVPLEEAAEDYLASLEVLAPHADYIAVNVSSPNTPGLRDLQSADDLSALVGTLVAHAPDALPVFVKLAPDLFADVLTPTLRAIEDSGAAGVIATNTTLGREGLHRADRGAAGESGGLSGRPLTGRALRFVESVARATDLPVMGVGGIMSPGDAGRMFDAGAHLVQLYTGFIYEGPALVRGINDIRRHPAA
ncbi:quinone-dependent dihydroorotate dehydrogenase [Tessaracoccus antarcticus]|uniref:Dihydroorotate dehydrogenase (quinone) n=1 Tax=Tessaracoccus antarcticus TaxID=2479848 RepID=A0A3M0GAW4_9ACTN|nr:quinone-dependent dihydroorotate dehydrogenase [Tessaracoccus antarcticus]RMB58733.1 quinone-dependent dihydroorotate dehydrogenase [Tessaracoccus antarcticus]